MRHSFLKTTKRCENREDRTHAAGAMGFAAEGLQRLGALCERTWHDRLQVVADGPAAATLGRPGELVETELCFPEGTDLDPARDVFPGCPLAFRMAKRSCGSKCRVRFAPRCPVITGKPPPESIHGAGRGTLPQATIPRLHNPSSPREHHDQRPCTLQKSRPSTSIGPCTNWRLHGPEAKPMTDLPARSPSSATSPCLKDFHGPRPNPPPSAR